MECFRRIVGNETAKQAIRLFLVNPRIGPLLILGERGSGKSLLLRSIASLCPEARMCPCDVTGEQLLGSIDLEKTLRSGALCRQRGLLESARGYPLLAENIHRMPRRIFHSLMESPGVQVAATLLEEEAQDPARQMDSFALIVRTERFSGLGERMRLMEEGAPAQPEPGLSRSLAAARRRLEEVFVPFPLKVQLVSALGEMPCSGNHWEIRILEALRTLAALEGRTEARASDLQRAFELVFAERTFPPPRQGSGSGQENTGQEEEESREQENRPPPPVLPENMPEGEASPEEDEDVLEIGRGEMPAFPEKRALVRTALAGKGRKERTRSTDGTGIPVGAGEGGEERDIDLLASIRCAAPYQHRRGYLQDGFFRLYPEDLRQKIRERGAGRQLLLVVDASGSLSAGKRMSEIKGAILSLFEQAYARRDRIGMIVFRSSRAELALPMGESLPLAKRQLEQLASGGNTPLALGLQKALEVEASLRRKQKDARTKVYVISDGRANWTDQGSNPRDDALRMAAKLGGRGIETFFVDYESARFPLGFMKQLAEEAGGAYVHVPKVTREGLGELLRREK